MECPKHVLVGAHRITIGDLPDTAEHMGEANSVAQSILLNKSLTGTMRAATLLHEVVHMILHHVPMSTEVEECLVLALDNGLSTFFRYNPECVKYMLESFTKNEEDEQCLQK